VWWNTLRRGKRRRCQSPRSSRTKTRRGKKGNHRLGVSCHVRSAFSKVLVFPNLKGGMVRQGPAGEVCVPTVNERKHGWRRDDRLLEVQLTGIVERTKYYAVWSLAEASSKSRHGARLTCNTRARVLSQAWDLVGGMRQVEACGIAYRISM